MDGWTGARKELRTKECRKSLDVEIGKEMDSLPEPSKGTSPTKT